VREILIRGTDIEFDEDESGGGGQQQEQEKDVSSSQVGCLATCCIAPRCQIGVTWTNLYWLSSVECVLTAKSCSEKCRQPYSRVKSSGSNNNSLLKVVGATPRMVERVGELLNACDEHHRYGGEAKLDDKKVIKAGRRANAR
jgi:hypothetical protein